MNWPVEVIHQGNIATGPLSGEPDPEEVKSALALVLISSSFRASKQSQRLLQYMVEHALDGQDVMLKERIVGANVFGRSSGYDTGGDPIVRVRAADVRKRLAQYYTAEGLSSPVRIRLYPGSYRPVFALATDIQSTKATQPDEPVAIMPPTPAEVEESSPHVESFRPASVHKRRRSLLWLSVSILGLASLAAVVSFWLNHKRAEELFWAPVLNSPKPVIIYLGTNATYRLSDRFLNEYRSNHKLDREGQEFFVEMRPGTKIDARDLSPVNTAVMGNDAAAAGQLISLLVRKNKDYELRWGQDISPGDLRHGPVIFVGAFNNNLTLELTNQLRLLFEGGTTIRDRLDRTRSWSVSRDAKGSVTDDYAIVSRLSNASSGSFLVTVAGIGELGTQAAGELLANEQQFGDALRNAPGGCSTKNMQILLHVAVTNSVPSSLNILAVHCW